MLHAQHRAQLAHLLRVPRERAHVEAVEQRHEARGPLAVVHVHRVDADRAELVRVALERHRDRVPPVGVHELDGRLGAQRAQHVEVGAAHPQPFERAVPAGDLDERVRRRRATSRRPSTRTRCRAARRRRRGGAPRARPARPRSTPRSGAAAGPGGRPRRARTRPRRRPDSHTSVSMPGRAGCERPLEGRDRVLGLLEAGPPVSERDRPSVAEASRGTRWPVTPKVPVGQRSAHRLSSGPCGPAEG